MSLNGAFVFFIEPPERFICGAISIESLDLLTLKIKVENDVIKSSLKFILLVHIIHQYY